MDRERDFIAGEIQLAGRSEANYLSVIEVYQVDCDVVGQDVGVAEVDIDEGDIVLDYDSLVDYISHLRQGRLVAFATITSITVIIRIVAIVTVIIVTAIIFTIIIAVIVIVVVIIVVVI